MGYDQALKDKINILISIFINLFIRQRSISLPLQIKDKFSQ